MKSMKLLISLIFMTTLVTSCSQESASSLVSSPTNSVENSTDQTPSKSEVKLQVDFDSSEISISEDFQINAKVFYSDGSFQLLDKSELEISSSNTSIVSNSLNALSQGTAEISIQYNEQVYTQTVDVFSANIVSIEFNKENISLPRNTIYTPSLFAIYDNGKQLEITNNAIYSSSNETIVTSGNILRTLTSGNAVITAEYKGVSATLSIEVLNSDLQRIEISPFNDKGYILSEQAFTITGVASDNSTVNLTASSSFTSSDETLATIDNNGILKAYKAGNVTVTATYNSFTVSTNFEILSDELVSIELITPNNKLPLDYSHNIEIKGKFEDGEEKIITEQCSFNSSNHNIVSINNSLLTTKAAGTSDLLIDCLNKSLTKTITVESLVLNSIDISPSSSLLPAGIDLQLTAWGNYSNGEKIDITNQVQWSSADETKFKVSNQKNSEGYLTNNYTGTSTSIVNVTANLNSVNSQIAITLTPATISHLELDKTTISLNVNKKLNLKAYAHFTDGASLEITNIATWSIDDTSIAVISNAKGFQGELTSITEGTTNLSVNYKGHSKTININIDNTAPEQTASRGTGLLATYFNGRNFDSVAGSRIDSQIQFAWNSGSAPLGVSDNFSVRWEGEIEGKVTADCTIASRSDDGFRVSFDDVEVLNDWSLHAPRWKYSDPISFEKGVKKKITVEFFENGGHAVAELYWQCPEDSGYIPIETIFLYPKIP